MTVVEMLKNVRARLSEPARWTQCAPARDADGLSCNVRDGCSWCLFGALLLETQFSTVGMGHLAISLLCQAMRELGFGSQNITRFNDSHTHDEVLAILDFAIAQESA